MQQPKVADDRIEAARFKWQALCIAHAEMALWAAAAGEGHHRFGEINAGLVERRKEGRWHYYRFAENDPTPLVQETLDWVRRTLKEDPTAVADEMRLKSVVRRDKEALCECYRKSPEDNDKE